MMAIRAIEIILLLLLVFFIFSQIIIPAICGLPLFPYFRTSEKLKEEGRAAKEEVLEEQMATEVLKTKQQAEKLRAKNQPKGEKDVH